MTITKYLHSCLALEEQGKTVLIDPGQYTHEAGLINDTSFPQLDYIVITHEHADHFSLPLITMLNHKFPSVKIISAMSVVKQVEKEGIKATTEGDAFISVTPVPHEEILMFPVPENLKVTISDKLTHPGDSFHFTSETECLAMPMVAPWGSIVDAMKKIIEVHPKTVIPIHDWHWKDEAIEAFYPRVAHTLKKHGIEFKQPRVGEVLLEE